MDRKPTPSLLPILRSQQQAELLVLLLGDPDLELSLSALSERSGVAYPSVHREMNRAEAAGIVESRAFGRNRLVRANVDSPYHASLANLLVRAFGPPVVLAAALDDVSDVESAYVFGSWAARWSGVSGDRPVQDIDLLVLGDPDRTTLYESLAAVEDRLGRPIQVVVRPAGWLAAGSGSFHATVVAGPLVPAIPPV